MRILFITQLFQPEEFFKGLPFAKELLKLGHQVEVLTGFPNYPEGKIYKGYKIKLFQKEIIDGIPVIRVPLYPSHDKSGFRRFINYASFAFSAAIIGPWVVKKADVAYVYHPPGTIGFPAIIIKMLRRIPFVYDIQDLWPESLAASGMFNCKLGLWLVEKWCRLVYMAAGRIVVLSQGFKKALIERGVRSEKIKVIYNWVDDTKVKPTERDPALAAKFGLLGKFNVVFAGNMGKGQALESVLAAADILKKESPCTHFVFVGTGVETEELKKRAHNMRLENVLFIPQQPMSEIGAILALADVLLVHLKNDSLYRITIPSKIQAYLAVGRPILVGVPGDATDLVVNAKAGLPCIPENVESIADGVRKFLKMSQQELDTMGENGRKFYQQELSLAVGTKRLAEVIESAILRP
ncbi:MAG: glycosyltransferase family 4 protein [Planctomycetota bacterium]